MLNLKIKLPLILPNKDGVYLGIAENGNPGQASYGKTIGKSTQQRRGMLFYRGNWEVGKAFTNKKPIGVK